MMTKHDFILSGTYFCEEYICFSTLYVYVCVCESIGVSMS